MKASIRFEPHDLWVGVFWRVRREYDNMPWRPVTHRTLQVFVCLLPAMPIVIEIPFPDTGGEEE